MNGRIWVESTPGAGTAFHFTAHFLAGKKSEPDGAADPATDAAPPATPATPGNGLRILLAEDNLINRELATVLLERRGHSLVHAANGCEAVEAAERENFDLIFMDVQMPEMDGLEATARIREAERSSGRHTPITAMTAHAMTGDRERFLAAGMDEYISKPLQRAELFALLERIAGERKRATDSPGTVFGATDMLAGPVPLPAIRPAAKERSAFRREEFMDLLDGDEALMRQMITLFHEDTPRLLDAIRASIARRSSADVARSTHALLSSLGVVGAAAARQLTSRIAARAEQGAYEAATSDFAELTGEIARVDAILAAFGAVPA